MPNTTSDGAPERKLLRRRKVFRCYLLIASLAAAARLLFLHEWLASPFRFYHTLFGLDMRKLVAWGISFQHGGGRFNAHAAFVALVHSFSGDGHFILANAAAQMTMGIATALMTAYIFRRLFGGYRAACCAGMLCALYMPMLAYEAHVLKATLFLFLPTASLALLLAARRRGFRGTPGGIAAFAAGALAAAPFLIRTAGLAWLAAFIFWLFLYFLRKRGREGAWRIPALPAAGAVAVVTAVLAFNALKGFDSSYLVNPNYEYLLGVGAIPHSTTLSPGDDAVAAASNASGIGSKMIWYLEKAAAVFIGRTVPNNINPAFIRSKIHAARLLIPPSLLIPWAAGGLLALIAAGLAWRRASILFLYLAAFVAPMTLFLPLERYRLVLTPVFCVAAIWWAKSLLQAWKTDTETSGSWWKLVLPVAGCAASLAATTISSDPIRQDDHRAYGIAACRVPEALMLRGRFAEAADILSKRLAESPKNTIIALNLSSALQGSKRTDAAEALLRSMGTIRNPALEGRRQYELAETALAKGDWKRAALHYRKCLELPVSPRRKKLALARLKLCAGKH